MEVAGVKDHEEILIVTYSSCICIVRVIQKQCLPHQHSWLSSVYTAVPPTSAPCQTHPSQQLILM